MMDVFLNELHVQRYYDLLGRDGLLGKNDIERESLFFIISGNPELYKYVSNIYNFRGHRLHIGRKAYLEEMCISGQNLLKLGINLYNGNRMADMDPYELLRFLDQDNLKLAINAMYFRFAQ